ncbi:hypothetical protein HZH68_004191 [Vespula germanica]|uniref:IGFBP N-terminal domain-containing protein n=1 Tax=Vespula germanica TaxID=30212 RepID=A0A834KNA1_VESGE|nr:hypothetical protein HZH68_004191 [Vespula germanica]
MRASLLLLGGIIVVLSIAVARALSCVCSPLECDVLTDEDCPGGLTWDPCRCCKVCARVEGEPCGGLFGFSGSCAVGLQCVIKNLLPHTREVDEGVCATSNISDFLASIKNLSRRVNGGKRIGADGDAVSVGDGGNMNGGDYVTFPIKRYTTWCQSQCGIPRAGLIERRRHWIPFPPSYPHTPTISPKSLDVIV